MNIILVRIKVKKIYSDGLVKCLDQKYLDYLISMLYTMN